MTRDSDNGLDPHGVTNIDRRDLLKAATAAGVGGVGAAVATDTAAAGNCTDDWQEAPDDYPIVDLRFSDPEERGDFPQGVDEILIYVHGWQEWSAGDGEDQGYTLEQALQQNGYEQPTVAALWNSNTLSWTQAKARADEAGDRLAAWLDDYLDRYPDTTVRTVDHSLGARVILLAMNELDGAETIADVALVGAAVDPDTVCDDGKYADGIDATAAAVDNYHSENDDIVCSTYATAEFTSALGCEGADCGWFSDTLDEYEDRDVTDTVGAHCDYIKPDVGCVPQIVAEF